MTTRQILLAAVLPLALSGCLGIPGGSQNKEIPPDGGVFRSADKGATWQQAVLIASVSGRPGNFAYSDISAWQLDPSDSNALYYSAAGQGLLFSYDSGNSWQKSAALGNISISDIAVDPNNKCVIYVCSANRVMRSNDCARTWKQVYYDNDVKIFARAVAVDHANSDHVYVGLSRGDLIKSFDRGETWQTVSRLKGDIQKFVIDPNDSAVVYLYANKIALRKSTDYGATWEEYNQPLKDNQLELNVNRILLFKNDPGKMYLSTNLGIIHTIDNGETWEKIKTIPPDKSANILDVAVNPQNHKEIYYSTRTTFFRSNDSGENWQTIKLPTTRFGRKLLINPDKPNLIYLGVGK